MVNYRGRVMPLEHREEHSESSETAHVNESPEHSDTPGSSYSRCCVRGHLFSSTTELVAETVIDAYEQTHYYGRAREYSLQAHH